jgi:hypothetical protein
MTALSSRLANTTITKPASINIIKSSKGAVTKPPVR